MKQSIVYDFFISSRYRVWRHFVLWFVILLIVFNQLFGLSNFHITFDKAQICYILPVAIAYLIVIYFTLYSLIPKYLLAKKYFSFLVRLILSVFVLNIVIDIAEFAINQFTNTPFNEYSIFNGYNFIADIIFSIFQMSICIMGIGTLVLLKQWMIENANISKLENEMLISEVEQLKQRIAPETLFRILNNLGQQAINDAEKASTILVKLSKVLRYQLYDCSHDKVFLKSEISFIENYLVLLHMNFRKPDYQIHVEGDLSFVFVPPLLFSSLLQIVIDKKKGDVVLDIQFQIYEDSILFNCPIIDILENDLAIIVQRLRFLYEDRYNLSFSNNNIRLDIPR